MKKLLALLLVFVCAMSMVACGGANKAAARKTVEGFMDAFSDLDVKGVEKYLDDPSAMSEEFKVLDMDEIMKEMPAELGAYSDDFEEVFADFIDKVKDNISYEIKEVEKNDDGFVFTLDVTIPDFAESNMEELLGDTFDSEAMQNLIIDMLASGEISATMTEEEMLDVFMPKLIGMAKDAFDKIEIGTETQEKELVVTKEDDEWLINTEKSDLDDLIK